MLLCEVVNGRSWWIEELAVYNDTSLVVDHFSSLLSSVRHCVGLSRAPSTREMSAHHLVVDGVYS